MKIKSPESTTRGATVVALQACAMLLAPTAFAGLNNNAVFLAADADSSGNLSTGEFTTTLQAGLSTSAIQLKFRAADRNLNGSVQLNEFLIFTGTIPAPSPTEEQ